MSIPVDLGDLEHALADFGLGYLLTTSAEGRIKAITVEVSVADGVVHVPVPSRGTAANLAANPAATMLFPPLAPRGYTLLVDGAARSEGDRGFVLEPASAVLHRPAAHADGDGGTVGSDCGHDCAPVGSSRAGSSS